MADEWALARSAAGGDVRAFTELVERHERGLRNFLDRLAPGFGDDLAQESFLRAWRSASSWRGESSYRAWLYRIGWRVYLSHRETIRSTVPFDPEVHGCAFEADPAAAVDLKRALAQLSDRERAAAILCFGDGCSHSEAAAVLGMALGSLKSVVARARAKLIDRLEAGNDQ